MGMNPTIKAKIQVEDTLIVSTTQQTQPVIKKTTISISVMKNIKTYKSFNESSAYTDPFRTKAEARYEYLNKEGAKIGLDSGHVDVIKPGKYSILQPDADYRRMETFKDIEVRSDMTPYELAVQSYVKFGKYPVDTPFQLKTLDSSADIGENTFPLQPTLFEGTI